MEKCKNNLNILNIVQTFINISVDVPVISRFRTESEKKHFTDYVNALILSCFFSQKILIFLKSAGNK
jgi:hypothetical protein